MHDSVQDSPMRIFNNTIEVDPIEDANEPLWASQIMSQTRTNERLDELVGQLDLQYSQVPNGFHGKAGKAKNGTTRRGHPRSLDDIGCTPLNNVGDTPSLVNIVCVILSISDIETCSTSYGLRNVVDVLCQDDSLEKGHYFPLRLWGHHANSANLLQPGDVVHILNLKPWNLRTWLQEKKGEMVKRRRTDVQLSTVARTKWHILGRMVGGECILMQKSVSPALVERFEALRDCSGIQLVQWTMVHQKKPKPAPASQFTCCRNFRDNAIVNLIAKIMNVSSAPFGLALQDVDTFMEPPMDGDGDEHILELLDEEGSLVKVVLDSTHEEWRSTLVSRINGVYAFLNLRVRWSPILGKGAYYLETIAGLSSLASAPKQQSQFQGTIDGGHRDFSGLSELEQVVENWKGAAWLQAKVVGITFLVDKDRVVNHSSYDAKAPATRGVAGWRSNTYGPFSSKWQLVRMICSTCNSLAIQYGDKEWKCGRPRSPCSVLEARFKWSWVAAVLELSDLNQARTISVTVGCNSHVLTRLYDMEPELMHPNNPRRLEVLQRIAFKTKELLLGKVWKWELHCSTVLDECGFGARSYHAKNVKPC